ncbi:MAG: ABC transporter ATP-binding protein [Planctomycetes bacterium]|nr:ABC transporter ATP-binding protein [Planctomycetota bacterium]
MSVVVTNNLTKRYGRRVGIEDVSITVGQGEVFGFLGPNGSGKTTTIRLLLGLLRPTSGESSIFDLDCWRATKQIKEDIGYLPGDLRLYANSTGRDMLRVFGAIRGRDLLTFGNVLADRFELEMNVSVRRMSRGMRQKLGLIIALAHKPKLIILDEPTASLDPLMQEQLMQLLREFASDGHTVFFSSHTLSEVERLCDRVAIVREGKIVADESLATLKALAKRDVTIKWKLGTDIPDVPNFLDLYQSANKDHLWQATLDGSVNELLDWLHGRGYDDFAVGHPDLESLFRRFYEKERVAK